MKRKVDEMLEELRKKLGTVMGVTLQVDTAGQWGQMGAHYLTLRWNDAEGELIEVSTVIQSIKEKGRRMK